MGLSFIEFLFGGGKKVKNNVSVMNQAMGNNGMPVPNPSVNQNAGSPVSSEVLQFQDQRTAVQSQMPANMQQMPAGQGSFYPNNSQFQSGIDLSKIHDDIKEVSDNVINLTTEIKDMQNSISGIDNRVKELENSNKTVDGKLKDMDSSMNKFLSLYEIVNSQYNPFVDSESIIKPAKEIVISNDGSSVVVNDSHSKGNKDAEKVLDLKSSDVRFGSDGKRIDSLLELDTLNIEEAAHDAVPLTKLKSNTNSLVVILSWLEYLVKRSGLEETKNILRYYTETLKWITPEVYFDLDKFLRGMDDISESSKREKLGVKDHIVSLYFISKLNEKKLDDRLTVAVLKIIKDSQNE